MKKMKFEQEPVEDEMTDDEDSADDDSKDNEGSVDDEEDENIEDEDSGDEEGTLGEAELAGDDSDEDSEDDQDDDDDDSEDDDEDIPNDPITSQNEKVIAQMDHDSNASSDDDAPEEISSKVKSEKKPSKSVDDTKEEEDEKKPAYEKADESRTVFCGNIPNAPNVNETRIKDLFSQYGQIKSVRFRTEAGRVIFSKKIRKECKSFIAYVVFEKEAEAQKALQINGFRLLSNVLRVNMANKKTEAFSNKGTIFVGNLLFEATESEVHDFFSQVGKIEYVRKIANKGIAYVCFAKGVNLAAALKLDGKAFKGRKLRISRCESRDKQDRKKLFKKDDNTGRVVKRKVKKPHKMSENAFKTGKQNNNNPIVKKIQDSQKAKFNKFADQATRFTKKELFRPGGKKHQNQRDEKRESTKKKSKFFGSKVDGIDKTKSKKAKPSKSIKQQKIIAKKLKSAAGRGALMSS